MKASTSADRMLEYGLMKAYSNISCFSTTRYGGCSQGNYASFNCNEYCGDVPAHVEANRRSLQRALAVPSEALVIPHQVHGVQVGVVDEAYSRKGPEEQKACLEGIDALVTDLPRYCLCVSTADCVPVLLYDARRQVVAAIHAGWRGTVARIVAHTLAVMNERYGSEGEDIHAVIGPSISQEAFEVGEEVYEAFSNAGFDMKRIARRMDKWHLDLWEANRMQLLAGGVKPEHVELSGICTYARNETFFSARRQGIQSGRILSGIMIHENTKRR